jgi:uncharacterized membrane protein SirB2
MFVPLIVLSFSTILSYSSFIVFATFGHWTNFKIFNSIMLDDVFVPTINMSQNKSQNKNTTIFFNTMIILKFHY